jgi:hypothetical protein
MARPAGALDGPGHGKGHRQPARPPWLVGEPLGVGAGLQKGMGSGIPARSRSGYAVSGLEHWEGNLRGEKTTDTDRDRHGPPVEPDGTTL